MQPYPVPAILLVCAVGCKENWSGGNSLVQMVTVVEPTGRCLIHDFDYVGVVRQRMPAFSEFIPAVGKRAMCFFGGFLGMKVLIVHLCCDPLEGGEESAAFRSLGS